MKVSIETVKLGLKVGVAAVGGIMVIGTQEAALHSIRKEKNKINKARERKEFYIPMELEPKEIKIEKGSIKKLLKEQSLNAVKETMNIIHLGTARSVEHFIREEQQQLLKKQSGNIYRHIEEFKNK